MYGAGFCFSTQTCLSETPKNQCWDWTSKPTKCADENGACGQTVGDCETYCETLSSCETCAGDPSCYWCLDSNSCHAGGCASPKDPGIRCPGKEAKDPKKCDSSTSTATASATATATATSSATASASYTSSATSSSTVVAPFLGSVTATSSASASASATTSSSSSSTVSAPFSVSTVATLSASATASASSSSTEIPFSVSTTSTSSASASVFSVSCTPSVSTMDKPTNIAKFTLPSGEIWVISVGGGIGLLILLYFLARKFSLAKKPAPSNDENIALLGTDSDENDVLETITTISSCAASFADNVDPTGILSSTFNIVARTCLSQRKRCANVKSIHSLLKSLKGLAQDLSQVRDVNGFAERNKESLSRITETLLKVNSELSKILKDNDKFAGINGALAAEKNEIRLIQLKKLIDDQQHSLNTAMLKNLTVVLGSIASFQSSSVN